MMKHFHTGNFLELEKTCDKCRKTDCMITMDRVFTVPQTTFTHPLPIPNIISFDLFQQSFPS
jgi:hypothetical protein